VLVVVVRQIMVLLIMVVPGERVLPQVFPLLPTAAPQEALVAQRVLIPQAQMTPPTTSAVAVAAVVELMLPEKRAALRNTKRVVLAVLPIPLA